MSVLHWRMFLYCPDDIDSPPEMPACVDKPLRNRGETIPTSPWRADSCLR
ncbi:MAG: hypothetical protein OXU61_00835 [Gammaproteobacteria bacterium]|nr:hypothetical protein [Gammaproteobacteria bacterium]